MTLLDGRLTPSDEFDEISSLAQPLSDPADLGLRRRQRVETKS